MVKRNIYYPGNGKKEINNLKVVEATRVEFETTQEGFTEAYNQLLQHMGARMTKPLTTTCNVEQTHYTRRAALVSSDDT
jgi:hypothetical protein